MKNAPQQRKYKVYRQDPGGNFAFLRIVVGFYNDAWEQAKKLTRHPVLEPVRE